MLDLQFRQIPERNFFFPSDREEEWLGKNKMKEADYYASLPKYSKRLSDPCFL
jgi:hypothetical protein